ncbi:MAG: hypothetical protein P0Y65_14020 [Candidatus Devosia phytovorans]|uniref:Uncharacterized protein n=1 Tax=Candidatus Devosia phytovorans TaxID=3121372 RepID=A0AAJ6AY88_9HYPH|nr:hypothetical protein [Devosia sp.]WEK03305.1 MAG: hypothetical protein P0Y65_14020 [Devosia sp.]
MLFDSLQDRMGGDDKITPMGIAHNSLFTAKEKLELLNQLKADATAAGEEGREIGFEAEEIDNAIAEVHRACRMASVPKPC